nr:immunoglobulin heavy chain junction region [Mus musculus]NSM04814.1 immunoglobulin heavy chain junction region [Mus musculus]NSM07888.1 immunoglobulin heavy chain junction region [Mus musculus]NSM09100.1 immunoglobulin heavy chain junction region [Mus musculus]
CARSPYGNYGDYYFDYW